MEQSKFRKNTKIVGEKHRFIKKREKECICG